MPITRRVALGRLTGIAAAAALAACGFQLRGSTSQSILPFRSIYVGLPDNSALGNELRRYIRAGGATELAADAKSAQAALEPLSETRDESVLSLNSQGRIRELSLFYRFKFRVTDAAGRELLKPTDIVLRRDMSFNEAQVLAKEGEKVMLYRDMQSDLVQQILRRLAALAPA